MDLFPTILLFPLGVGLVIFFSENLAVGTAGTYESVADIALGSKLLVDNAQFQRRHYRINQTSNYKALCIRILSSCLFGNHGVFMCDRIPDQGLPRWAGIVLISLYFFFWQELM